MRSDPDGARKVILATNIAQTSLTVEGVTTVVDGGWVRVAAYDLASGANRLVTRRISRAAADQRALPCTSAFRCTCRGPTPTTQLDLLALSSEAVSPGRHWSFWYLENDSNDSKIMV